MQESTGNVGPLDSVIRDTQRLNRADDRLVVEGFSGSLPQSEAQSRPTAAKLGYRELTDEEAALVIDARTLGESIEALLKRCERADPRWSAIARTHFQEGLMALVRAITRPKFF